MICDVIYCDNVAETRGLCYRHYREFLRTRDPSPPPARKVRRLMNPTDKNLTLWLAQWQRSERTKNEIEREEMNDPRSHGKAITRLWRERLGVETEAIHPLRLEVDRLLRILADHNIDPAA